MCRDNREHNYKELERRDAIKETVDDFIGEIIEIGIGKEDISYIFRYLKLELERIDTEDVYKKRRSIRIRIETILLFHSCNLFQYYKKRRSIRIRIETQSVNRCAW